jgi:lantibiotic modifying enzyme
MFILIYYRPKQYSILGTLLSLATLLQLQFRQHNLHIPAVIFASLYQFFQYNV